MKDILYAVMHFLRVSWCRLFHEHARYSVGFTGSVWCPQCGTRDTLR